MPPQRFPSFLLRSSLFILASSFLPSAQAVHQKNAGPEKVELKFKLPPPAPLSWEEELKTFKVEKGFHIELVASEPMIESPVAMSFDDQGRLYVVEMRGYMHDLEGGGEKDPTGRVSLLEDTDGDGRMDKATPFLDNLVMPRAVLAVNGGALIAVPPNLYFCKDTDGDGKADVKDVIATDFGTQGDKPTHPELLDDLAARFIANGWSLKWLHREILLSSAFQQSSARRPDGDKIDQTNALLWRMNPRRLDIEAWRDSILKISGALNPTLYGLSEDIDAETNTRRTIYARVSRGRLANTLKLYDFPEASQSAPARDLTTTPLQQLYVMNGPFLRSQAALLAKAVEPEADNTARLRALYRKILARDPSPKELDLGLTYLAQGKLDEYAHVLLATNEVLFQK